MAATLTLITENGTNEVDATIAGDAIRLAPETVKSALGWQLKSEGLCRDDTCIPVRDWSTLIRDDGLDLAELARLLDRPLAVDVAERVAVLGASAEGRAGALRSLVAPDVALPDLAGRTPRLSDHREKKRLLIAWASW